MSTMLKDYQEIPPTHPHCPFPPSITPLVSPPATQGALTLTLRSAEEQKMHGQPGAEHLAFSMEYRWSNCMNGWSQVARPLCVMHYTFFSSSALYGGCFGSDVMQLEIYAIRSYAFRAILLYPVISNLTTTGANYCPLYTSL